MLHAMIRSWPHRLIIGTHRHDLDGYRRGAVWHAARAEDRGPG